MIGTKFFIGYRRDLISKGAPKGQIPRDWDETLRQKDCNLIKSWKDLTLRLWLRVKPEH
jgi:hypothetical protein